MLLTIADFIGHFHPVLVHLPIGILLLALALQGLSHKGTYAFLRPAIPIVYLFGAGGALFSCLTGLALASGGEYEGSTVQTHQWMGILLTLLASAGYVATRRSATTRLQTAIAVLVFVITCITGHLGGTLTHGEGYLTQAWTGAADDSSHLPIPKNIPDVQEAMAYADVVQPILQAKCYGCHSASKQKGGLRLDGPDWLRKGGKNGPVLMAGKPVGSELYTRLLLDPLEEKHMPPKGKPQLTEKEIMLLGWWITNQHDFVRPVKALAQSEKEKAALESLENNTEKEKNTLPLVPTTPVAAAPVAAINALRAAGISVLPVAVGSNYLSANFVGLPKPQPDAINLLAPARAQLAWLKLEYAQLNDSSLAIIGTCTNLTQLSLRQSNLTDTGLARLKTLTKLQYLNLSGTKVTAKGLRVLQNLPDLRQLYLYQTPATFEGWANLQQMLPKVKLDSGGYRLETLATDTMLAR